MIVPKRGALYKYDNEYYIVTNINKTKVEFSKVTITDSNDDNYYIEPSEDHETKTIKSFIKDFVLVY